MSMTYTWKMKEIKVMDETNSDGKVLKDAVVQTLWEKTGKDDDGNEGRFMGATPLTAANVSESDFSVFSFTIIPSFSISDKTDINSRSNF